MCPSYMYQVNKELYQAKRAAFVNHEHRWPKSDCISEKNKITVKLSWHMPELPLICDEILHVDIGLYQAVFEKKNSFGKKLVLFDSFADAVVIIT